jgi:hypothetical protein
MGQILAHGLGGRSDLPVPMWLAQYGAAVALVFSFAALHSDRLRGQYLRFATMVCYTVGGIALLVGT